jgi:hypothetical protein
LTRGSASAHEKNAKSKKVYCGHCEKKLNSVTDPSRSVLEGAAPMSRDRCKAQSRNAVMLKGQQTGTCFCAGYLYHNPLLWMCSNSMEVS